MSEAKRTKGIVKVGIIGIIANLFLSCTKAFIGIFINSIAIILDAINNLFDAISSILTVVGAKIANRAPDKEHPLGHGRLEYITAFIIGSLIIYVAINSFVESIRKITDNSNIDTSSWAIIFIILAIVIKLLLGLFTLKKGKQYNSETLKGSGKDALFDVLLSFSTLVGIVVFWFYSINIDGYLGIVITIFILKTGIEIIKDSISDLLGERADPKLTKSIRKTVMTFKEVIGVYDLFLENYGPSKIVGSLHIEISDTLTCREIDDLCRKITHTLQNEYGVLVTIGIYAIDTTNHELTNLKKNIISLLMRQDGVLEVHGFKFDDKQNIITMDVVKDFSFKDTQKFKEKILDCLKTQFSNYEFNIIIDLDYCD